MRNQRAPGAVAKGEFIGGDFHSFCTFVYSYFNDRKKPLLFWSRRIELVSSDTFSSCQNIHDFLILNITYMCYYLQRDYFIAF